MQFVVKSTYSVDDTYLDSRITKQGDYYVADLWDIGCKKLRSETREELLEKIAINIDDLFYGYENSGFEMILSENEKLKNNFHRLVKTETEVEVIEE